MRAKHWLSCIAIVGSLLISSSQAEQTVRWQPLESAKQMAGLSNRLVLIHFWSEACPPCLRMDKEVFTSPDVAAATSRA